MQWNYYNVFKKLLYKFISCEVEIKVQEFQAIFKEHLKSSIAVLTVSQKRLHEFIAFCKSLKFESFKHDTDV